MSDNLPPLPEPALTSYYGGSSDFYEEPHWDAEQMRAYAAQAVALERERIISAAAAKGWGMKDDSAFEDAVRDVVEDAAAIRKG